MTEQAVSSTPLITKLLDKNTHRAPIELDFKFALTAGLISDQERDPSLKQVSIIQNDIADYLQYGDERKEFDDPTRWWLNIQAPRGFGKTWIIGKFVAWMLKLDPTLKIMIVSKNEEFAKKIFMEVRNNIETCPLFHELRPGPDSPSDNKTAMYVTGAIYNKDPSISAYSVEGKLQGMRADVIIGDDVESTQNSNTVGKREDLYKAVKEFVNILKPGGMIVLLGTPQTNDTIYHRLVNNGYCMRIWPALFPTEAQMRKAGYGEHLAPLVKRAWTPSRVGKIVDPLRFSQKELDLKRRGLDAEAMGESDFELQFMLDPTLSDVNRFPLKTKELVLYTPRVQLQPITGKPIVTVPASITHMPSPANKLPHFYELYSPYNVSSDEVKCDEVVMAIDPAGSGSDEAAYAVVARQGGRVFLLDSGGFFNGTSPEVMAKMAQVAKKWGVHTVVAEKNWGGGMYGTLLRPVLDRIHPCYLENEYRATGQKEVRIIKTLEPLLNSGRLIVSNNVVNATDTNGKRAYNLLEQLSKITRDKAALDHDDRLDALAIACDYLKEKLRQQVEISQSMMHQLNQQLHEATNQLAVWEGINGKFGADPDDRFDWTANGGYDL